MKIKRQISDRVTRRFFAISKVALFLCFAHYLKHKSVSDILQTNFGTFPSPDGPANLAANDLALETEDYWLADLGLLRFVEAQEEDTTVCNIDKK